MMLFIGTRFSNPAQYPFAACNTCDDDNVFYLVLQQQKIILAHKVRMISLCLSLTIPQSEDGLSLSLSYSDDDPTKRG